MEKQIGVYKLVGPGRIYIGSSINLKRRFYEHMYDLKQCKHANKLIQKDYNNGDLFHFEIIEYCNKDNLLERENYWINKYGGINSLNLYNLFSVDMKYRSSEANDGKGTNNSMYGRKHTMETRKRLSELNKQRMTPEMKAQISNSLKGHKDSDETRLKKRNSHLGKPRRYTTEFINLLKQDYNELKSYAALHRKYPDIAEVTISRLIRFGKS